MESKQALERLNLTLLAVILFTQSSQADLLFSVVHGGMRVRPLLVQSPQQKQRSQYTHCHICCLRVTALDEILS